MKTFKNLEELKEKISATDINTSKKEKILIDIEKKKLKSVKK